MRIGIYYTLFDFQFLSKEYICLLFVLCKLLQAAPSRHGVSSAIHMWRNFSPLPGGRGSSWNPTAAVWHGGTVVRFENSSVSREEVCYIYAVYLKKRKVYVESQEITRNPAQTSRSLSLSFKKNTRNWTPWTPWTLGVPSQWSGLCPARAYSTTHR